MLDAFREGIQLRDIVWPLIILLILAVVLRSELFFYLLYLVVGLHIAARWWVSHSARRLRVRRSAPEAAFPGDTVSVTIEVQNTGLLPVPWLSLRETLPPALHSPPMVHEVISPGAAERCEVRYTLFSRRRGYYPVGPLTLQTGDVLGIGERTVGELPPTMVTIYPAVLPLEDLGLPASLPFGVLPAARRLFTDPARPMGTRPYQPVDGVRRIDWKATARLGEPQVRRYQQAIAVETMIALAFSRAEYGGVYAYDTMERALVAAASIAAHLIERRQMVGICTTGFDAASHTPASALPPGSGRARLIQILALLGRLELAQEGDLAETLVRSTTGLGWGNTVVMISGQRAREMLPCALGLRQRGLNVALVIAGALPEDLALARRHGVAAYDLGRGARPQRATGAPASALS
jgi:uncharacterized protein (DUF58 family)